MTASEQLETKGYVVTRSVLSAAEVDRYRSMLLARAGVGSVHEVGKGRGTKSWNHTDGVSKEPDFWDLIFHERLLAAVEDALGPGFKYLQHSDLQVGFSAVAWHRDNVNRTLGVGPDWDDADGAYGLVRVGIYLQEFATSNFRLGFIPGSHRLSPDASPLRRKVREAGYTLQGAMAYLGPRFQSLTRSAEWVATDPGDVIVFDPRVLHSGSYIKGLKMSMFVGYGHENRHFADLQNYYRHVRTELGYRELDPTLVARLERAGLFASSVVDSDEVADAYRPAAPIRRIVARRVKNG